MRNVFLFLAFFLLAGCSERPHEGISKFITPHYVDCHLGVVCYQTPNGFGISCIRIMLGGEIDKNGNCNQIGIKPEGKGKTK